MEIRLCSTFSCSVFNNIQASLEKAKSWIKELQRQAPEGIVIALAGNKLDLAQERRAVEKAVSFFLSYIRLVGVLTFLQDAEAYAAEANLLFFETSAKTAENVNELFTAIAKKLPLEDKLNQARGAVNRGVNLSEARPAAQPSGSCSC